MSKQDKCNNDRRRFLRNVATTTPAAVAAAAMTTGNAQAGEVELQEEQTEKSGYRVTSHITDYYKSASV